MKKVVGIFAHPDDEALGPSGTLALLAQDHEVYLLCVTSGEAAGKTPEQKRIIGETRRQEIQQSAKVIGVREVIFLGYEDGQLCNSIYHQLADDIAKQVERLRPETLLTFELRGISGHIDHVTVAMVTTYVFEHYSFIKKLMYYTLNKIESKRWDGYFIFFPEGYERSQVDQIVDIEEVWNKKVEAMFCHKSQIKDVEKVLENTADLPKEEYFLVRSR